MSSPGKRRLEALDGLRGIAALVVVFHHLELAFLAGIADVLREVTQPVWPTAARILTALMSAPFDGKFAVSVFWTLSGIVLSLKALELSRSSSKRAVRTHLADMALRRYPRLALPVFASVIFAYCLHEGGAFEHRELSSRLFEDENRWLLTFYTFGPDVLNAIGNALWTTFFAYREVHSYNAVLWTMELELAGSLLLFAFLALGLSQAARFCAYPLLVLATTVLGLHWLSSFVLGTVIADLHSNRGTICTKNSVVRRLRQLPLNSVTVSVSCLILISLAVGLPNYKGVADVLLSGLLCAVVLVLPPLSRLLGTQALQFFGRISFALYLLHLPIILSAGAAVFLVSQPVVGSDLARFAAIAISLALAILAARLFAVWIDAPAIRLSHRFSTGVFGAFKTLRSS